MGAIGGGDASSSGGIVVVGAIAAVAVAALGIFLYRRRLQQREQAPGMGPKITKRDVATFNSIRSTIASPDDDDPGLSPDEPLQYPGLHTPPAPRTANEIPSEK